MSASWPSKITIDCSDFHSISYQAWLVRMGLHHCLRVVLLLSRVEGQDAHVTDLRGGRRLVINVESRTGWARMLNSRSQKTRLNREESFPRTLGVDAGGPCGQEGRLYLSIELAFLLPSAAIPSGSRCPRQVLPLGRAQLQNLKPLACT